MTFAISCPKCIRYFLSVRSRLCWAESPGLAEWWPYGSPHVGTRRVAPPYSVLRALMPSPTPTHEALLRPGAEAWQVKVRALVLPSPSTPRCSTHTVSCRLLTVESVTLTKGWKLPEDSLQPKELPFPPVLRHPGLHPPGPAGDSITVALVQTDPTCPLPAQAGPPTCGYIFPAPPPLPQPLLLETAESPALSRGLFSASADPDALGASPPAPQRPAPDVAPHHPPAPLCPGLAGPALKRSLSGGGDASRIHALTSFPALDSHSFCPESLRTHPHCTPSRPSLKALLKGHLCSEAHSCRRGGGGHSSHSAEHLSCHPVP